MKNINKYLIVSILLGISSCGYQVNSHKEMKLKPMKVLSAITVGITSCYSASDVGLIGWFNIDCPEGWTTFEGLTGRVAIGAGNYVGNASDGRPENFTAKLGDTLGEYTHKTVTNEMPEHNHVNGAYSQLLKSDCTDTISISPDNVNCWEPNIYTSQTMLVAGNSEPHNNIQPSLVLNACIKFRPDNYTDENDFLLLQQKVSTVNYSINNDYMYLEERVNAINYTDLTDFINLTRKVNSMNYTDKSVFTQSLNEYENKILELQDEIEDIKDYLYIINQSMYYQEDSSQLNNMILSEDRVIIMILSGSLVVLCCCLGSGLCFCFLKNKSNYHSVPKNKNEDENEIPLPNRNYAINHNGQNKGLNNDIRALLPNHHKNSDSLPPIPQVLEMNANVIKNDELKELN